VSPSSPALDGLRFSLIGAGSVGQSLAGWIVACGGRLLQVAGRPGSAGFKRSPDTGTAAVLARRLGGATADLRTLSTAGEDLLLIAVPDDALAGLAATLAARPQARVALHVSGVAPAAVLDPLRPAGSAVGGFHPLRAFPAPEEDVAEAAGVFFALDGDPPARALGQRLAVALGGIAAPIAAEQRPLYHLVATLMAGAVTTVVATAMEIAARSGLPPEARPGFARLATAALAGALAQPDPAAGITGPAARGDQETFLLELARLHQLAPEAAPIVVALARESLRQRARVAAPDPPRIALAERLAGADLLDLMKDRVLTSTVKPSG
jgi:predicted short-subunit dehydrogenase-like oxidoreductase (DUF2520 family)